VTYSLPPPEVFDANDVFRSEPAIAARPGHIRKQAPSILFGQDELLPEDVTVIVVLNFG
jgi:hypothetical protein